MRTIFLLCCLLFWTGNALGWEARCVGVSDGDTITVRAEGKPQAKIRLYGIDAPESKQDFGRRAKEHLASLVAGEIVDVDVRSTDRNGRLVAVIRMGQININEEMLAAGLAWVYPKYCKSRFCKDWQDIEEQARTQQLGIWSHADPVEPWVWRKQRRKK